MWRILLVQADCHLKVQGYRIDLHFTSGFPICAQMIVRISSSMKMQLEIFISRTKTGEPAPVFVVHRYEESSTESHGQEESSMESQDGCS